MSCCDSGAFGAVTLAIGKAGHHGDVLLFAVYSRELTTKDTEKELKSQEQNISVL